MKKKFIVAISLSALALCSCTSSRGPSVGNGLGSAFKGIAHLVLSPIQIASGLLEGIASVPFFMSQGVHEINKGMLDARAKITLDDTYESAYGKRIKNVSSDGDTGEVFRRMKHATQKFQSILEQYGVADHDKYILTSIDTATPNGYTLFAVVKRDIDTIKVIDKHNTDRTRTYSKRDRMYYEPYQTDISGYNIDTVIDWSGIPSQYFRTQKGQALLLTIAANSVVNNKRSNNYWQTEKRWMNGEYKAITENKMNKVLAKLKENP